MHEDINDRLSLICCGNLSVATTSDMDNLALGKQFAADVFESYSAGTEKIKTTG